MGSIGHDKPPGNADDAHDFRMVSSKHNCCFYHVVINDDGHDASFCHTNDLNICKSEPSESIKVQYNLIYWCISCDMGNFQRGRSLHPLAFTAYRLDVSKNGQQFRNFIRHSSDNSWCTAVLTSEKHLLETLPFSNWIFNDRLAKRH